MARETCLVIYKENGVKFLVLRAHYEKYKDQYELIVDDKTEEGFVSDKDLRDKLRDRGITFRGKKSRDEMLCMLDELPPIVSEEF